MSGILIEDPASRADYALLPCSPYARKVFDYVSVTFIAMRPPIRAHEHDELARLAAAGVKARRGFVSRGLRTRQQIDGARKREKRLREYTENFKEPK